MLETAMRPILATSGEPAVPVEQTCDALEQRYPVALEHIQEYAIFMLRPDGVLCTWNVGIERIFGYTREEWIGSHGSAVFTPEDCANGEPEAEMARAAAKEGISTDRWYVRKDGSRFLGNGVVTAVYDDGKELLGFCKVVRDNSDRAAATEALERARTDAAARFEMQAGLGATIEAERARFSQELHDGTCQELAAAALLVQLKIREFKDHPAAADALRQIEKSIRTAAEHIRSIAAGLYPSHLASCGLASALEALTTETSACLPCTLSSKGEVHLPAEIELHLYRIAQEAIANAVKHSKAKEIKLHLSESRGTVLLSIRDDGQGFHAGNGETAGMGLRNMRSRADAMGADLLVDSKPSRGTTVQCTVRRSG